MKAEAYSARRAARPAWRNEHLDRQARELEAKRIAKEYRQAQRQAERASEPQKQCTSCNETLPLSSFGLKLGKPRSRCRSCFNGLRRANRGPSGELTEAQKEKARARSRANYHRKLGHTGTGAPRGSVSPERQRHSADRIAQLTALLMGTDPHQRIASEGEWNMATSELHRLWLASGDKECVSCKQTVPPSAILPPGPANFYPGKCQKCATAECHENTRRVTGRAHSGPPLIPMLDGSAITIGEFARRHRERQQSRRVR